MFLIFINVYESDVGVAGHCMSDTAFNFVSGIHLSFLFSEFVQSGSKQSCIFLQ